MQSVFVTFISEVCRFMSGHTQLFIRSAGAAVPAAVSAGRAKRLRLPAGNSAGEDQRRAGLVLAD